MMIYFRFAICNLQLFALHLCTGSNVSNRILEIAN